MKAQRLIGESGGSKTDWALLRNGELIWQLSTESLHPSFWTTNLFNHLLCDLLDKNLEFQETDLFFFGAGCNGEEKKNLLAKYFSLFGFGSIEINGDLMAAGIATLGSSSGWVAILGSGSVLIDFQNGKVERYFGGVGRQNGDEGGGYFAGKLVAQAFANNELNSVQLDKLKSVLSANEMEILERNEISEDLYLKIPQKLGMFQSEFQDIHFQNIGLFIDTYVKEHLQEISKIHFVGSYAFYHQDVIKLYFQNRGIETGNFVARPIGKLIEFFGNKK